VPLACDNRLSAKLVPTLADRGVSRGRNLGFLDRETQLKNKGKKDFITSALCIIAHKTACQQHVIFKKLN
jgi:hypothetical protein